MVLRLNGDGKIVVVKVAEPKNNFDLLIKSMVGQNSRLEQPKVE